MTRREFTQSLAGAGVALALDTPVAAGASAAPLPEATARSLPRWRGFNLLEKFDAPKSGPAPPFRESDFALMEEWGFNFARLPMSYRCWTPPDPARWREMDETQLREIDQAIAFGKSHGVHINLNLHRLPGFCVNAPAEPLSLWKDAPALEATVHQWVQFARRYRGIPNPRLSFNLLNEPQDIPAATYERVIRTLVKEIRSVDPDRLMIADGLHWARRPVPGLADLGIAQSLHGYDPYYLTHYRAGWPAGSENKPLPTWPCRDKDGLWDVARLRQEQIAPWRQIESQGVGVHVGEWGAYHFTPHDVTLAWMRNVLALWREAGWGWALWNLRGSFGPLNSGRKDVSYEARGDLKVDRAMLDLLRAG